MTTNFYNLPLSQLSSVIKPYTYKLSFSSALKCQGTLQTPLEYPTSLSCPTLNIKEHCKPQPFLLSTSKCKRAFQLTPNTLRATASSSYTCLHKHLPWPKEVSSPKSSSSRQDAHIFSTSLEFKKQAQTFESNLTNTDLSLDTLYT